MNGDKLKIAAVIAVAAILVLIILFKGSVTVTVKEDVLSLRSLSSTVDIPYSEIRSVRVVTNVDRGEKITAVSGLSTVAGRFSNDEYGEYILITYKRAKTYVELVTDNGVILFSARKKAQTEYYADAVKTMLEVKK